jgi:predicted nucleic acid-binding protein
MKCWVIDTNVVVYGLLTPGGPSARVLDAVLEGRIRMVYDARILAEYRDVLRRPRFRLKPGAIDSFLGGVRGQMLVAPVPIPAIGPDPDDLIFVEAALAAPDRTIVTGNLADYPAGVLQGARVITPTQAVGELGP